MLITIHEEKQVSEAVSISFPNNWKNTLLTHL